VPDLNHTIVWCLDRQRGAQHLVDVLGLDQPADFAGQFLVVNLGNGVSLDYADWAQGDITPQHLAFLVSEDEFDQIYGRIQGREITHWADPSRRTPGEINRHDGGRGVYWEDPDGHLLEIITRPYGAETEASGG
jgi:catechol 2,3-dioxygenase-like lactoylglutathione lyase family enzyme